MRNLRRHADALAQRGVRVNRLADVDGIRTHLNGQRHFTNHVARMRADHAAAQDLAVTVGLGQPPFVGTGHTALAGPDR